MNINKAINLLMIKLSEKHKIFYMEKRSYKEGKTFKSYTIKIDNITKEFTRKTDLLIYLSKRG